MKYQEYINLGFKRHDLSCSVEFRQTGYYGFALSKKINKRQSIEVTSGELDKPKLYIKKKDNDTYHIIPITPDAVIDLLEKDNN
jgi:hypothetical protein